MARERRKEWLKRKQQPPPPKNKEKAVSSGGGASSKKGPASCNEERTKDLSFSSSRLLHNNPSNAFVAAGPNIKSTSAAPAANVSPQSSSSESSSSSGSGSSSDSSDRSDTSDDESAQTNQTPSKTVETNERRQELRDLENNDEIRPNLPSTKAKGPSKPISADMSVRSNAQVSNLPPKRPHSTEKAESASGGTKLVDVKGSQIAHGKTGDIPSAVTAESPPKMGQMSVPSPSTTNITSFNNSTMTSSTIKTNIQQVEKVLFFYSGEFHFDKTDSTYIMRK